MALNTLGRSHQHLEAASSGKPIELIGDSAEIVALALLRQVAQVEDKSVLEIDRAWLLDTYAECLTAVRGDRATKAAKATPAASKARRTASKSR